MEKVMEKDFSFKDPGIIELLCGIRFEKGKVDLETIWKVYDKFKEEFKLIEEQAPLGDDQFITNESAFQMQAIRPGEKATYVRYWFLSEGKDKLIQIQDGAVFCNWRRMESEQTYPKFDAVFGLMQEVWNYLLELTSGGLKIRGCELSYINHFDPEKLGLATGRVDLYIKNVQLEGFWEKTSAFKVRLNIPVDEITSIYLMDLATAQLRAFKKEVVVLTHAIKSKKDSEITNVNEWFRIAHARINEYFMDLITDDLKKGLGYIK